MKLLAILFSISLFTACNMNTKSEYVSIAEPVDYPPINTLQEHPGKQLMENNCYVCHNPKTAEESMIAPPMVAVKMHYISGDISKEEFINAMMEWAKNPSEENSKMPGAVKKFGLMPYQFFPEETIRQIADYMYESEIETPQWFEEHYKNMHGDRPMMKGKRAGKKKIEK